MKRLKRSVELVLQGRDAQEIRVPPRAILSEIMGSVARQLKSDFNRPFAVEVRIEGRLYLPTADNCRANPRLSAKIVLTQYIGTGTVAVPNQSWRLVYL